MLKCKKCNNTPVLFEASLKKAKDDFYYYLLFKIIKYLIYT